ncbi:MAG: hypothetical protein J7K47_06675, partial [Thermoplasmata archaeon]|nr:hypothetical protein [Thermoplasmata archaeon]
MKKDRDGSKKHVILVDKDDAKYKLGNIKNLYYFIRSKAKKLGKPFDRKSKRGRPYTISPYE